MRAFVVVCTAHALIAPPVRLRERTAPRATSGDYLAGLGQSTVEEVDAEAIRQLLTAAANIRSPSGDVQNSRRALRQGEEEVPSHGR